MAWGQDTARVSGEGKAVEREGVKLGGAVVEGGVLEVLAEAHAVLVALGEDRGLDGPVDADIRVVPGDGAFGGGCVEAGAFVLDFGGVGEGEEGVAEAFGDPELTHVFGGEFDGEVATEGGGADAEVDGDIEDGAVGAAYELAHGGSHILVVEAAEDGLAGAGVVVLDEVGGEAVLAEALLVVDLDEEAAFVTEEVGIDDEDAFEGGG